MPDDGCVIIMGIGDKHIGVYLCGGIIHAMSGRGVIFDDAAALHFRGLGNFRAYKAT